MKMSVRIQKKVLNTLIDLSRKGRDNIIYRPINFPDNFDYLSPDELIEYLKVLESEELITVLYADYPENFNIHHIQITPKGLFYIPKLTYANQQKWVDRIISFIIGVFSGVTLTYFIPMLIHRLFSYSLAVQGTDVPPNNHKRVCPIFDI